MTVSLIPTCNSNIASLTVLRHWGLNRIGIFYHFAAQLLGKLGVAVGWSEVPGLSGKGTNDWVPELFV
jgi:hypothetical protein